MHRLLFHHLRYFLMIERKGKMAHIFLTRIASPYRIMYVRGTLIGIISSPIEIVKLKTKPHLFPALMANNALKWSSPFVRFPAPLYERLVIGERG